MAKQPVPSNGQQQLEEAMAMLIQNQAAFLSRVSEMDRVTAERFARIEADMATILRVLAEHGRVLAEHTQMLERLPDALRDKIGLKIPP